MSCARWLGLSAFLALFALAPAGAAGEPGRGVVLDAERRAALASLPVLSGAPPRADDLAGRVVVVSFFASWCPPCRSEFDHLNATLERFGGRDITVIAVNLFEDYGGLSDETRLARFLADTAPRFAVLSEGARVASLFGDVARIPTLFVFGRDGRPVLHFIHERGAVKTQVTAAELAAALESAL